jgi:hypothetical protein
VEAGSTFVLAGEHRDIDDHLWVVLSDPRLDDQKVLIVSLTTFRPHKDRACIIQPGEHDWVRHETCVAYDLARTIALVELHRLHDAGAIVMQPPLSAALLDRVRRRVADSRLPMDYADLLIDQGLLDL